MGARTGLFDIEVNKKGLFDQDVNSQGMFDPEIAQDAATVTTPPQISVPDAWMARQRPIPVAYQ